ncbi:MAG TPA: TonB family protein, partial [Pyrinomonadaceae bacterium]
KFLAQVVLTFLLNATWQVALVVAFAACADWLLRGIVARYRHALWVVTLLACVTIPGLSAARLRRPPPPPALGSAPIAATPVVISRILTPDVEIADTPRTESSPPAANTKRPLLSGASINMPARLAFILLAIYLAFLLLKVLLLVRAWRRTQSIVRGASDRPFPARLQAIVERCTRLIGVQRVRIVQSPHVPVPITLGVVNPIIVLPESLLAETDRDLLSSALGHELVHVARRDYLWNLLFEIIYLPVAFHPAAAVARRRIRQTREHCCDDIVATKLLNAEIYAHSLMRLIGSAPLSRRLMSDTTIGLNQSDILEVRIMSLLKSKTRKPRHSRILLIAAGLILATPCLVGAKLALGIDIYAQEPSAAESAQDKEAKQRQEKALQELKRQAGELNEKLKVADEAQRKEIEAHLLEVQKNLEEHERALTDFRRQQESLEKLRASLDEYANSGTADVEQLKKLEEQLAKIETKIPQTDALLREVQEKLAAAEKFGQKDRKAKLIYRVEPEYTADAREKQIVGTVLLGVTVGHDGLPQNIQIKRSLFPSLDQSAVEAVRKWRFEPALKDGQPVSMYMLVEFFFSPDGSGADAYREKEEREKAEYREKEYRVRMNENEAARRAERESEEKRNTILATLAQISMDQAIQIATSKSPGKVIECSLVGEQWESAGELAKPSLVLYHVVILSNESSPARTHVLINAIDGSVFRVSKEEKREDEETVAYATKRRAVEGGALNDKALSLPNPEYPTIARAAKASGPVTVEVIVDEQGNVIDAKAISGHPLLQNASVKAAWRAKFAPTSLEGKPVKVTGVIVYNFTAQ